MDQAAMSATERWIIGGLIAILGLVSQVMLTDKQRQIDKLVERHEAVDRIVNVNSGRISVLEIQIMNMRDDVRETRSDIEKHRSVTESFVKPRGRD